MVDVRCVKVSCEGVGVRVWGLEEFRGVWRRGVGLKAEVVHIRPCASQGMSMGAISMRGASR